MKYIIDLEKINGTELYKAKGFNTLVFDTIGIGKLEPYEEMPKGEKVYGYDFQMNEHFRTPNGKTVYIYKGFNADLTKINAVNVSNGNYVTFNSNSQFVRLVERR